MKTVNLQTRTIRLAGICCLILACTACSDEAVIDPVGESIPITIKAEISTVGNDIRTEAVADDPANDYDRSRFITGDLIRVTRSVTNPDYRNYILGADGKTWSVQGSTPLSLRIGASYQATYPNNYSGIAQNQTAKANYLASNLLQTPVAASSSGELDFTGSNAFVHQNTKITLEFSGAGTNTTLAPDQFSNFTISGTGLRTGAGTSEQMTFYRPNDRAATWHGIVFPKSASTDISLSLIYDKVTYSATIKCPMEAGKHYKYSLKIQNDILVPDGMTIEGWINDEDEYTGGFDSNTPAEPSNS